MIQRRALYGWFMAFCLVLTLMCPAAVLADDDSDSDEDEAVPAIQEEEGSDDAAPQPVGNDDDVEEHAREPEPINPVADDNDDLHDIEIDSDEDADADLDDENDDGDDSIDDDEDIDDPDDEDLKDADEPEFDTPIRNQAIVRLRSNIDPAAFAAGHDAIVLRIIPSPNIVLLGLNSEIDDDSELSELMSDDEVIWAEFNYTSRAPVGLPYYFFTSAAEQPRIVDAPALPLGLEFTPDQACSTGESVVVAVLDTGVDASHPALSNSVLPNGVNMASNTWVTGDFGNNLDDDGDGRIDEMVGHGTYVSGIVLQVAPGAHILPVTVLNSDGVGDAFVVTAGIYYAVEQRADIINLSLGTTYNSSAIQTAIDFASSEGVVVVAAAGNSNQQADEYPAAAPSVISVAATTATAGKTRYSNFGDTVDISAPGNNAASAFPGGLYATASGTSISTPLVSGDVALVLERQPGIDPEHVLEILQSTSGPLNLSDPAFDGMLGSGEIDIDATIACGD